MKLLLLFLFVVQTYADIKCGNLTCTGLNKCKESQSIASDNSIVYTCVFDANHLWWIVPVSMLFAGVVWFVLPRQDR